MRDRERTDTRTRLAIGLLATAVAAALIWIALIAAYGLPGRDRYSLVVRFDDAATLPNHAPVRIAGRLVGQAQKPRAENGEAVFDLELDPEIAPLRSGTKVRVRPLGLLGQQYLDLIPSREGTPLVDGATIPAENSSASVRLHEVLSAFDPRRREELRTVVRSFGAGFLDRGGDIATTLEAGPPTLDALGRFADSIRGDGRPPRRLVRAFDRFAGALNPVRQDLALGFDPSARALAPFAERRDDLRATLDEAPATLAELDADLPRVDSLLDSTADLSIRLTPLLRAARPALAEVALLLEEGRGPIGRANELLAALEAAVPPVLAMSARLRPLLPRIGKDLGDVLPSFAELSARRCDLDLFGRNWSSMLGYGYEGGGEIGNLGMIRYLAIGSPESLSGVTTGDPPPGTRTNPYPEPCEAGTELDR